MTSLKRPPQILFVFVVVLLAISCGSDAPQEAPEEATTSAAAPGKFERATWQLQAGEDAFEGNMAFVARGGGKIHLQLVNAEAVNLAMLFPEKGAGAREVEHSYFAIERG